MARKSKVKPKLKKRTKPLALRKPHKSKPKSFERKKTPPPPAPPSVSSPSSLPPDPGIYNAILFGIFAAVNRTFGTYGAAVLRNASQRTLEFAERAGWGLPPKSKDPLRALREFCDLLVRLGMAKSVTLTKKGEEVVVEVQSPKEWPAIRELRALHYPTLPFFIPDLVFAFLDTYFKMNVSSSSLRFDEPSEVVTFTFTYRSKLSEGVLPPIPESTPVPEE